MQKHVNKHKEVCVLARMSCKFWPSVLMTHIFHVKRLLNKYNELCKRKFSVKFHCQRPFFAVISIHSTQSEHTHRYTQQPDKLAEVLRQFHKTFSQILHWVLWPSLQWYVSSPDCTVASTAHLRRSFAVGSNIKSHAAIWLLMHISARAQQKAEGKMCRVLKALIDLLQSIISPMMFIGFYAELSVTQKGRNVENTVSLKAIWRSWSRSHRLVARPPVGSIVWYTHLCHSI